MKIPERNTIFLQGVYFSQVQTLEERMLEENIAQNNNLRNNEIVVEPQPIRVMRFVNKRQWAEAYRQSTLKCWYCSLCFKGVPCFIPRQARATPNGRQYDALGLFCGFSCAFTFLHSQAEFVRDKSYFDKLHLLKMLFREFYGKQVNEFKEAPNLYDLVSFGGHLDIVDYRNCLRGVNAAILAEATPCQ